MSRFKPGLVPTLVVFLLLPILIWLGIWQLERGEQKRDMLARQDARQQAAPVGPEQIESLEEPAYSRIFLQGSFDAERSFLLDSRTRDGQVGVELLQPFQDQPSGLWVLVNRGWIPWPDRRIPPKFDTPDQPLKLAAWVYAPSGKPFVLNRRQAEGWPRLINHVDVEEIWGVLERDGVAYELRLEPGPTAYRADWPITTMQPQQHLGYAVQWFALAAALLALFIYFGVHQARGSKQ
ncbi:SURF1 family protein [Stutzerimonas zhaodongensis]|uniref:SURF1 family protein n=1 Tax=Stutzerimonas zhaodongensis TaxID=1176257 RepID=UPI0039EE65E0